MFMMYLCHFQHFQCLLKRIQISNFFSTRLAFNALFLKSLIFSDRVNVVFFKKSKYKKKIRKIKNQYLDKRTKNTNEENEGPNCFWNHATRGRLENNKIKKSQKNIFLHFSLQISYTQKTLAPIIPKQSPQKKEEV
jgi:hypothetical protein